MSALCTRQEVTKQEAEKQLCTENAGNSHMKLRKRGLVMKLGSFCFGMTVGDDNAVLTAKTELSFRLLC